VTITAVVGAQFGDEAKGKIVDYLSSDAEYVVRYQGGPNAGHTIRPAGRTLALHQLPVGIVREGCTAVCGAGMVVDPFELVKEIRTLRDEGLFHGKLLLSERAHLILPWHRIQDAWEEETRGSEAGGTTGRGIGPAYMDRAGRWGIRVAELFRPEILRKRLQLLRRTKGFLEGRVGAPTLEQVESDLLAVAAELQPFVAATEPLLWRAVEEGRNVLLEGAQSALLDVDYGTYPFVTSSHPTAAGAALGSGLPPQAIEEVLGISKAYATRVGAGPFPTEALGADGDRLRERGGERGATTGRPRRCGWLDLVLLRFVVRLNGLTALALTKVDVLGGEAQVPVAVGYRTVSGETVTEAPPTLAEDLARVEPLWRFLPGWEEFTPAVKERLADEGYRALPRELRRFVEFVSEETGVPVALISYGPSREETVVVPPGARSLPGGWPPGPPRSPEGPRGGVPVL